MVYYGSVAMGRGCNPHTTQGGFVMLGEKIFPPVGGVEDASMPLCPDVADVSDWSVMDLADLPSYYNVLERVGDVVLARHE